MAIIEKLNKFKAGEKAVAEEVNQNFEALKDSNNEQEQKISVLENSCLKTGKDGAQMTGALRLNEAVEIFIADEIAALTFESNYFKLKGNTPISAFIGWICGIVIIEFLEPRVLRNGENLRLQNNADRLALKGDIGIYSFSQGKAREISYFGAKEERTNSFLPQGILNCPKNANGKADFFEKIEFTPKVVPNMIANEDDFCKITASSQYDAVNYFPWKCYRGNNADPYGWLSANGIKTGWTKVEFKTQSPKVVGFAITSINSAAAPTSSPRDFIIEGSNDDVNWDLLGDYVGVCDWLQNEKRYFALNFFAEYKYYRLTCSEISGAGTYLAIGMLEYFEAQNNFMPMVSKIALSPENPLLLNNAKGMSMSGKINELAAISETFMLENLLNNSMMYVGMEKQEDNSFAPMITTAQPVYAGKLQNYSDDNSIPDMISHTTSVEFKKGYLCTSSGFSAAVGGPFYSYYAFNRNLALKWIASVVGNNQWIQFEFPSNRVAARFSIVASATDPAGCIKNGYIKGFDGEEWVILCKIQDQINWGANEFRYFDATTFKACSKFKLEITEIQNPATSAQLAQFELFELADCFVVPENSFFKYDPKSGEYIKKEINYIGRLKTEHNFVTEARSYAQEGKYTCEEFNLAINTTYSLFHNIGVDFKNLKVSTFIKDKINGFILPYCFNGFFHVDDCQMKVRTGANLLTYTDYNGVARAITANSSLVLQVERNF